MRKDRSFNQMREISFEKNVNIHADGSCLVKFGNTHVLCLATIDEKVPHWLKNTGKGWVTAEYGMLPRSTNTRMDREAAKGKQSGRTQEIQRLIGRSLRSIVDLSNLGERQIKIDCDVIQADGGTRTASIRIPGGDYLSKRIEHRVAGADANPYLVLSSVLSSALYGITEKKEPPKPLIGDTYQKKTMQIAQSWDQAINDFEKSKKNKKFYFDTFCEVFKNCKKQELEVFNSRIENYELVTYLEEI